MRKSQRGISLIEVIIGLTLAFLLSMMVHQVVIPSFRLVQENQIHTELQQQGQLAMRQLISDLELSIPTAVSLAIPANDTERMIVASQPVSQAELTSMSTIVLVQELNILWNDVTREQLFRIVYKESAPIGPALGLLSTQGKQFPRPSFDPICQITNSGVRSFAKSVVLFRVEKVLTSGGEVFDCHIGLRKDIPNKKNKKAQVDIIRKVMLRNHQ